MDYAIRASDSELVCAEDYLDTQESPYGFCCPYKKCGVELRLKSYTSQNLKAPYFAPISQPHTAECGTFKNNRSPGTTNGIDNSAPIPYKNKLVWENESRSKDVSSKVSSSESGEQHEIVQKRFHNRTAKHLMPIVKWYLQNPLEGDSELEVPGCNYKNYKSIFQKIYTSPQKEYIGTHVFFGQLFIKNHILEEQENQITFNLYQGNSAEPIQLKLCTKGWTESSKEFVISLSKEAIKKSKEAYGKDNRTKVLPYVFFLGHADNEARRTFYCNRHAAFYAVAIEDLELYPEDCGIYKPPISSHEEVLDWDMQNLVDPAIDEKSTDLGKFESSNDDDLSELFLGEISSEAKMQQPYPVHLGMTDGTKVQSEFERKKVRKLSASEQIKSSLKTLKSFFMSFLDK